MLVTMLRWISFFPRFLPSSFFITGILPFFQRRRSMIVGWFTYKKLFPVWYFYFIFSWKDFTSLNSIVYILQTYKFIFHRDIYLYISFKNMISKGSIRTIIEKRTMTGFVSGKHVLIIRFTWDLNILIKKDCTYQG